MSSSSKCSWWKSLSRRVWGTTAILGLLVWLGAGFPACGLAAPAQSSQPSPVEGAQAATPPASGAAASAAGQAADQQTTGTVTGSVNDPQGGPVRAAFITLARNGRTVQQALSGHNGQFFFSEVAPGVYSLTLTSPGFKPQSISVAVQAGQTCTVPPIVMALAPVVTSINVTPSHGEIAHYQLQQEEKQLVLGFVPNYLVTYYPHTSPLSAREKFQLTFKTIFNPFTLGLTTAFVAGEQATGMYRGYGTEEKSFAKRFGASYATLGVGAFVGDALLPSILKQDPRYYYKANGSFRSKLLYAITRAVICKGDNGHWEPDYSAILGHFTAGAVANLYLPQQNRNPWNVTLKNGLIGIGFDAFANILQEFVLPKLTPALAHRQFGKP